MKKIFILSCLVVFSLASSAQNLWKAPVLPEEEIEIVDVPAPSIHIDIDTTPILHNQFRDYVEFQKQHQPIHRPIPQIHLIRPKEIIRKKDVVIVIYSRQDYEKMERLRRYQRIKMMERFRPR